MNFFKLSAIALCIVLLGRGIEQEWKQQHERQHVVQHDLELFLDLSHDKRLCWSANPDFASTRGWVQCPAWEQKP